MADIDHRFAERLSKWLQTADPIFTGETSFQHGFGERLGAIDITGMDKLLRAQEAWIAAVSLWINEDDAFEFLTRKHAMLEDRRPILAAIESLEGLRSVEEIIGRLRYGSAA